MAVPITKEEILKTGEIDPELEELLKHVPVWNPLEGSIQEMRNSMKERMEQGKDLLAALVANINVHDTMIKMRDGHEIMVRIFQPKEPKEGGSPLAVMYHGGGFILGDPAVETVNCALMCDKMGFVCVSVDYRLAPEHKFPVGINDSWDALQWAAANASSLGADPSVGFIVGGTSAGGNISAVMLYLARDTPLDPPLTGALLSVPVVVSEARVPEKYAPSYLAMKQNVHAPVLNGKAVDGITALYEPDVDSPLFACLNHPKGHKGLPPVYIQVCGMDPLRDDGLLYEKVLREEAGVKTKIDVYPGLPHAFWAAFPTLSKSPHVAMDTLQGVAWLLQEGKSFAK